jgi:TRAP-type uncharacterized transport system substrate-binding protein
MSFVANSIRSRALDLQMPFARSAQGRLRSGDALWQGAVVPIPSLSAVADQADAVVFGLSDAEIAALLLKLPQLAAATIPAGTYLGQTADIRSVSAWNFVVANKDLPIDTAYAITKAVLSAADPKSEIYPTTAAGSQRGQQPGDAVPSWRDAVL